MRLATVDQMGAADPAFDRRDTGFEFGNHTALRSSARDHLRRFIGIHPLDKRRFVGVVGVETFDIGQQHQLRSADGGSDVPCDMIRIDIVTRSVRSDSDRGDNRNIAVFAEEMPRFRD